MTIVLNFWALQGIWGVLVAAWSLLARQCGSHVTHGQLAYKTMLSGLPNTGLEPCTQRMVVSGLRGDIIQIWPWKDREIVVVDAWPKDHLLFHNLQFLPTNFTTHISSFANGNHLNDLDLKLVRLVLHRGWKYVFKRKVCIPMKVTSRYFHSTIESLGSTPAKALIFS